jgi:hypothetical protein
MGNFHSNSNCLKMKTGFYLLIMSLFSLQVFAQTTELPRLDMWNAKSIAFDDGSYVVEVIGTETVTSHQRKVLLYNADGTKLKEQSLVTTDHWGFSPGVINVDKDGSLRSVVDTKNKISYTLYVSKSTIKVTKTDIDFNKKVVSVSSGEFGKSIVSANWGNNSRLSNNYISYLGEDGNPGWLIRSGDQEIIFVKFNDQNQSIVTKKIQIQEKDYEFIGRENGKAWIAGGEDYGSKKGTYKIKLKSVDENGDLKDEKTITLKKRTEIMLSKVIRVYDMDHQNSMIFGVAHFDGKVLDGESDYAKHVDFIKITEGEAQQVSWELGSSVLYNGIPSFIHHTADNGTERFVINAGMGGIGIDVNFEESSITNTNTIKLQRVGRANIETWNVLLYFDELSEEQMETLNAITQDENNTQYVFQVAENKFIIVQGRHFFTDKKEKEKTTVKVL